MPALILPWMPLLLALKANIRISLARLLAYSALLGSTAQSRLSLTSPLLTVLLATIALQARPILMVQGALPEATALLEMQLEHLRSAQLVRIVKEQESLQSLVSARQGTSVTRLEIQERILMERCAPEARTVCREPLLQLAVLSELMALF